MWWVHEVFRDSTTAADIRGQPSFVWACLLSSVNTNKLITDSVEIIGGKQIDLTFCNNENELYCRAANPCGSVDLNRLLRAKIILMKEEAIVIINFWLITNQLRRCAVHDEINLSVSLWIVKSEWILGRTAHFIHSTIATKKQITSLILLFRLMGDGTDCLRRDYTKARNTTSSKYWQWPLSRDINKPLSQRQWQLSGSVVWHELDWCLMMIDDMNNWIWWWW